MSNFYSNGLIGSLLSRRFNEMDDMSNSFGQGPVSLEQYQNFLRGQSQGNMEAPQPTPNDNLGFIVGAALPGVGRGFSNYMQRDDLPTAPSAPAPMPDNVAAMSGVPTGATDTSSMTREEIAALPQMRDISNKMMANTTVPSMNNPMGFSPNLGVVGRGIMGGKGGVS